MVKAIDVWANLWPPEIHRKFYTIPEHEHVVKVEKIDTNGITPEEAVAMMDEAGVEITFVTALKIGCQRRMRPGWSKERLLLDMSFRDILPMIEKYPNRFRGLYGINPWMMMDALREMEVAVKQYGFVGAVTHVTGFAPYNDRIWYPFYAKCVELDIPVITQIGHYGEETPEGYGHPLLVDDVALDFPELRIVAGHTGWPWCDELVAEALKHPNVYISMEAYLPKYWDASMVRFINTRGRDKVMWGTDWPITTPKRNLEQVEQLGLRDEAKRNLLRNNAIRIFKLNLPLE